MSAGAVGSETRYWYQSLQLTASYVLASARRDKAQFRIGVATIAIVVGFIAVLQSAIQNSPYIFVKLGEDEVGEIDMLLSPQLTPNFTGGAASVLLNHTDIDARLHGNPAVAGTAARWALLGSASAPATPANNITCFALVMDTDQERRIGLGRTWTRRRLGRQEAYVSTSLLQELGIRANRGERMSLTIDVLGMAASLSGGSVVPQPGGGSVRQLIVDVVEQAGLSMNDTVEVDLGGTTIGGVTVPEGVVVTVQVATIIDALVPVVQAALTLQLDLIVLDAVDEPLGKWPKSLGNVVVLEKSYMEAVLAEQLEGINAAFAGGTLPPAVREVLTSTSVALRQGRLNEAAMLVVVQYSQRSTAYLGTSKEIRNAMVDFSDSVFMDLGAGFSAGVLLPVAATMEAVAILRMFLDQIFNIVLLLLGVLGIMVIYSLLLGDVEAKTYEYGMLRALGMRNATLALLLLLQAGFMALPGLLLGLGVATLLNLIVRAAFKSLANATISVALHPTAVVLGVVLATVIPLLANIVPIQRALSRTLRDALDLYHQTFSEVTVRVIRLESLGLSPAQTATAITMVVVGFMTYYLVPLSFVFQDIALFLTLLNAVLMGMLLGLTVISQTFQPWVERGMLWCMMWGPNARLRSVVRKNLAGHRRRNAKTAYMVAISVSFLVFAGSMFALQAANIQTTAEAGIGADVVVTAPSWFNSLPLQPLNGYLARSTGAQAGRPVSAYSYVSFPLSQTPGVRRVGFTNLARVPTPRGRPFGVDRNLLDASYDKYLALTDWRRFGSGDVVKDLVDGAGTLQVSVDAGEQYVPPPVLSADATAGAQDASLPTTEEQYSRYLDVLVSGAVVELSSVSLDVPLSLSLRVSQGATQRDVVFLAKGRAVATKVPGFFGFSSYRGFGWNAPLLMPMQQMAELTNLALRASGFDEAGNEAPDAAPALTAATLPKQRLLVSVTDAQDPDMRRTVVNGLRSAVASDAFSVSDTRDLLSSADEAAWALDLFFTVVAVVCMLLCFFASWLSFSANIRDNAREFGILRAIGLNVSQVLRCYLFEALAVVFTAFLLGSIIGILVAISLTLQLNLFTEMPFQFEFPTAIFLVNCCICLAVALLSSTLPALELMRAPVARVVKGVQWVR